MIRTLTFNESYRRQNIDFTDGLYKATLPHNRYLAWVNTGISNNNGTYRPNTIPHHPWFTKIKRGVFSPTIEGAIAQLELWPDHDRVTRLMVYNEKKEEYVDVYGYGWTIAEQRANGGLPEAAKRFCPITDQRERVARRVSAL